MSCVPTTSTEYSTTRQTLLTEVWTTSTRSIPIFSAITTSDGQVFTPIRVVEVSSAVEVTTVVASVIPARTVVVDCTDTAASTSESSRVTTSSFPPLSAAGPGSMSLSTSSPASASSTTALLPSSAASAPESTTTSLTTTITLTIPPTSSAARPEATSSSSSNTTDPAGILAPQSAEEELSNDTIGGLTAGGIGLFVLILVALWFVQRQFGRGIGEQGSRGDMMGKRTRRGGGGQGGSGQYRGMSDEGSADLISEKEPDSNRPPPLLPAVATHTRWSAITLPPVFRPPAPTVVRASISSSLPSDTEIPPVPIRGGSHIRHTSAPLSLNSNINAPKRPVYDPAISPTPAKLNRQERAERAGSVWNRLSALTWRMSWSLPSPIAASASLRHPAAESSKSFSGSPVKSMEPVVSVDLPAVETRGSARVGRIPSMVDLRQFGQGIQAVSHTVDKPESRSRTGSGLSTPPHLAPARPSSEYIREEDKPVHNPPPGGLPPPPMRSNSLVRNQSKRSISVKSRDNGEQKKSHRRSDRDGLSSPKSPLGRMIAGSKRLEAPSKGNSRSSRGLSREGSRTSGSTIHDRDPYPSSAWHNLNAPSAYAQPGLYPISTRKDRRPPSLHFAKEVNMPRLWIPDQSIAALNPESARHIPREPTDSAYDGMTEIDFTPLSAVRRVTPRTLGREEGRKGLPKLPPMETSASSSFKADWEAAVSGR